MARSTIRRLARALAPQLAQLERDERDAVNALALHLLSRFAQPEHEPLDPDGRTFLTIGFMQRRLREVGARKSGEKAAACRASGEETPPQSALSCGRPGRLLVEGVVAERS